MGQSLNPTMRGIRARESPTIVHKSGGEINVVVSGVTVGKPFHAVVRWTWPRASLGAGLRGIPTGIQCLSDWKSVTAPVVRNECENELVASKDPRRIRTILIRIRNSLYV